MTAADPTRDRTAPEAEEKAPSAAVPGVPAPEPPALEEPTDAARAAAAQARPAAAGGGVADRQAHRGAGGLARPRPAPTSPPRQGLRLRDTDHSLKAGDARPDAAAGPPPAREDHALRPRAHPRAGRARARRRRARRVPSATAPPPTVTRAGFLAKDVETPVFVRFSTVLGSRGSADTVRDTRGFATKFYTDEGTFDLVGNNIPVFFIQDGDQVPRRHPRRPSRTRTARSRRRRARTTPSGTSSRCTPRRSTTRMWNMSDRGIPRSYRTMEGFGVHTFRLVDADGRRPRW